MLAELDTEQCGNIRSVDCTHIKIHQDAAKPPGAQAMERTKGCFNSKLATVFDSLARAVSLNLVPELQDDLPAGASLLGYLPGKWLVGDTSFDVADFRMDLARTNTMVCIPSHSDRRMPC